MNIPIEDNFTDILGKAKRGLGLTDATLAERLNVSLQQWQSLEGGAVDDGLLRKAAVVLALNGDALVALAQNRYTPDAVPPLDGVVQFNTVWEDMTVNSYVVWDPASREAAFFDTGADGQGMLECATEKNLNVRQILLTHTHTDHILDLDRLKEKTGATAHVCALEALEGAESFTPGKSFEIGALQVETRLTSGHSVGGVTFFIRGLDRPVAVVGDAIFAGSMGGGMVSFADALRNNREQILTLPDETVLCPGHGPLTTVGEQKRVNPFFAS